MCIIIYKPATLALPSQEVLSQCFNSNSDGAGIAFVRDRTVTIHKGFMNVVDFFKALKEDSITSDDEVMFHFRWATSGGVSAGLCHPYPITEDIQQMKEIRLETDLALAHNGVLDYHPCSDLSDTMILIKDILADPQIRPHIFELPVAQLLRKFTQSSRLVILSADNVLFTGGWVEENGCYYSNTSYKYSYNHVPVSNASDYRSLLHRSFFDRDYVDDENHIDTDFRYLAESYDNLAAAVDICPQFTELVTDVLKKDPNFDYLCHYCGSSDCSDSMYLLNPLSSLGRTTR